MIFENAKWAINIETTSTGWANGNTFDNMTLLRPISGIRTRRGASSEGLDANNFNNIQIQPAADMEFGIDSLAGSSNRLTNIDIWDIDILGGSAKTAYINSNSTFNYITGMNIMGKNYADLGDRNTVFTSGVLFESTNTFGTVSTNIEKAWFARTLYYTGSGNLDITTDPQIADGANGQIMTIAVVTNYTVTLDDGDGLDINGPCVLSRGDAITLQYNSTRDLWVEISRSKNRGGNSVYFIAANDASTTEKLLADAQCDGTADEVQINAALTAGYNVRLSSGTFNIAASITAAINNLTIEGAGKEKTTIFQSNGANTSVIIIGGNYWVIKNLLIDGNDANNTGSTMDGIKGISMSNITIDNCEIKNVEDYAIEIRNKGDNWTISNSYIHTSGCGIWAGKWDANTEPENIKITNCKFSNMTIDSHVYIQATNDVDTLNNVNVDNCRFTGTTGYMGVNFSKAQNCNITNSYFDVDEAIGAGVPANVRYYSGATGSVIGNTFMGAGNGTTDGFSNLNLWGAHDVRIIGNYFTSASSKNCSAIAIEAYESTFNTYNIMIEGNSIYNLGTNANRMGIALLSASTYTISNITINSNTFYDSRGASAYNQYAITTTPDGGTIKDIIISNNTAEGMLAGFAVINADNVLISNNIIKDIPTAIEANDGDDLQIIGNKFISCTTPIDVDDSDVVRPFINGNTMYGCTNNGTYAGATGEIYGSNIWNDGTASLTGTPTAPTASTETNTTQIATTAFVRDRESGIQAQLDDTTDLETVFIPRHLTLNPQTTNYTLVLTDDAKIVTLSVGSANTLTVPPNSSVAFPVGTQITIVSIGTGQTTITPGSGVTINSAGGALKLRVQYSSCTLIKTATDTWLCIGDITT